MVLEMRLNESQLGFGLLKVSGMRLEVLKQDGKGCFVEA
jgi:hypothetical protein